MLYPLSTLCRLWVLVSKVAWPLTSKGVLLARPPLALSCFAACLSKYLKMCVRPRMHNCEKSGESGKNDWSIIRRSISFHRSRNTLCSPRQVARSKDYRTAENRPDSSFSSSRSEARIFDCRWYPALRVSGTSVLRRTIGFFFHHYQFHSIFVLSKYDLTKVAIERVKVKSIKERFAFT